MADKSVDTQEFAMLLKIICIVELPWDLDNLSRMCAMQTSGEAVYVADVGVSTRELFAAPVEASQALAKLGKVDPTAALKLPGVVAFVGKTS